MSAERLQLVVDSYHRGIAFGAMPLNTHVCHGRESVRAFIGRDLGLTHAQVKHQLAAAVFANMLTPDMPPPIDWTYPQRVITDIRGTVLVGGDLHAWPGAPHPIWWAFCRLAYELQPAAIILNGDVIDGARVSRHPRGRTNLPTLKQEIDAAQELLSFLPAAAEQYWTLGNHDLRMAAYLANQAVDLDGLVAPLDARFPEWKFAYSVVINGHTEVRHRFRSGIHAGRNNAVVAGRNMITSHTHALEGNSVIDRNGRHFGFEIGMLADPDGPQFEYGEGAPSRHWPGFGVLTFNDEGELMPPEKCEWHNGNAIFRGQPVSKPRIRVKAG